jgi:hypothetical protein
MSIPLTHAQQRDISCGGSRIRRKSIHFDCRLIRCPKLESPPTIRLCLLSSSLLFPLSNIFHILSSLPKQNLLLPPPKHSSTTPPKCLTRHLPRRSPLRAGPKPRR